VDAFPAKFQALVAAFRADTGIADLPFYYVQIGRHVNGANVAAWNKIQEYQRQAEAKIPNSGMVAAVDLGLDDQIHVGTQDLKRLGRRLAMLAAHDLFGDNKENAAVKRGPRPESAKLNGDTITLKLADVNGQLVSEGRINGFTVQDAKGAMVPMIYKSRFDPADPTVIHLSLVTKLPEGATLSYGAGKDPYCNVRDTSDMALPVFGPLKIQQ
jgi:sialate O-acetylesterase